MSRELGAQRKLLYQWRDTVRRGGAEALRGVDRPRSGEQAAIATARPFEELFELATEFLRNPCKLWDSGHLTLKRTVLGLAFAERVAYGRQSGFEPRKQPCRSSSWMVLRAGI